MIGVTGDAMARPLADALEKMQGDVDLSSLFSFSSTAAIFSQTVKEQLGELLPDGLVMSDAIGSTESGMNGIRFVQKGDAPKEGITTVMASADTVVLDDDLNPIEPGTGMVGRLARGGNIPLGYYNDPEKTAETFLTDAQGRRWSIPGDCGAARSRRPHHVARARFGVDQLRRREDLPRRGRRRVEVAPRRVRRARGRACPTNVGARRVTALLQPRERQDADARGAAGALPRARSPATRSRASCSSSTKCRGCPTASPTTGAPRNRRRPDRGLNATGTRAFRPCARQRPQRDARDPSRGLAASASALPVRRVRDVSSGSTADRWLA